MSPQLNLPVSGLVLALTLGCGTEPNCTTNTLPAVVVAIHDAFDGSPLAETARGAVREGEFIDSLRPYSSLGNGVLIGRAAAEERAGMYTVTVQHAGYLDWQLDGVRVGRNECHVETVELTAYLSRSP